MKRPFLVFAPLGFSAIAVVAACSGADSTELFGASGTSTFGTTPGSSGSDASASGGSSGGSVVDGSTSGSSGGTSGSVGKDSGPPAWTSPGITCGQNEDGDPTYCTSPQFCCATKSGISSSGGQGGTSGGPTPPTNGGDAKFTCTTPAFAACQLGATLKCDDRTDCSGSQICCAVFDASFGYQSSSCATSCTTPLPTQTAVQFCDPNAPTNECKGGLSCNPSTSLLGYHICSN